MKNRPALISAIVGVVVVGLIAVFALSGDGDGGDTNKLIGKPVPTIDTVDTRGRPFRTSDYRGRFLLVNFFGTWCIPCRVEHPELVKFANKYARTGEAGLVSVAYQDSPEAIDAFFAEQGGDWAVVNPEDSSVIVEFGIVKLPESYLVDPDGTVVHKFVGGVTLEAIEEQMAKAS